MSLVTRLSRDHVGEVERVELLVGVAQAARARSSRSVRAGSTSAEEVGGEEVRHVEGRILAHEDDVELGERRDPRSRAGGSGPRRARPCSAAYGARAVRRGRRRGPRLAVVLLVAATLALEQEDEGGVLVEQDPAHRIHDVEEAQGAGMGVETSRRPGPEPPSVANRRPSVAGSARPRRARGLGAQHARAERDRLEAGGRAAARPRRRRSRPRGRRRRRRRRRGRAASSSRRLLLAFPRDEPQAGPRSARAARRGGPGRRPSGTRVRPDCLAAATRDPPPALQVAAPVADHARPWSRARCACTPSSVAFSTTRSIFAPFSRAGASTSSSGDSRSRPVCSRRSRADGCSRVELLQDDLVLAARVVEDAQAVVPGRVAACGGGAAPRPSMRTVRVAGAHAGNAEPQHQPLEAQRAPRARGPRGGEPQRPGTPPRRASACVSSTPETTSRPRAATTRGGQRGGSATSVSASRLATTRSKRRADRSRRRRRARRDAAGPVARAGCRARAAAPPYRCRARRPAARRARQRRREDAGAGADVERAPRRRRRRRPARSPPGRCAWWRAGRCRRPCRARSRAPRGPARPARPTAGRRAGARRCASGRWWCAEERVPVDGGHGRRTVDVRASRCASGRASARLREPARQRVARSAVVACRSARAPSTAAPLRRRRLDDDGWRRPRPRGRSATASASGAATSTRTTSPAVVAAGRSSSSPCVAPCAARPSVGRRAESTGTG